MVLSCLVMRAPEGPAGCDDERPRASERCERPEGAIGSIGMAPVAEPHLRAAMHAWAPTERLLLAPARRCASEHDTPTRAAASPVAQAFVFTPGLPITSRGTSVRVCGWLHFVLR